MSNTTCSGSNSKQKNEIPVNEIIYLTGMSINKKTVQKVYGHISQDPCYDILISETKDAINKLKEIHNAEDRAKKFKEIVGKAPEEVFGNIETIFIDTSLILAATALTSVGVPGLIAALAIIQKLGHVVGFKLPITSFFKKMKKQKKKKFINNEASKQNIIHFTSDILECIVKYGDANKILWSDLFAIYQSSQSDVRALNSLASGDNSCRYALNYAYADLPFYNNLFVNNAIISLSPQFLKELEELKELNGEENEEKGELEILFKSVFLQHCLDTFFSRMFAELSSLDFLKNIPDEKHRDYKIAKSFKSFVKSNPTDVRTLASALKEHNLFGINLLSRILSLLLKLKQRVTQETTLCVYLDSEQQQYRDYLEELFEYAACPTSFSITDKKDDADITISMNYWDGKIDGDLVFEKETHKEGMEYFFQRKDNKFKIKVPVKLFISLPVRYESKKIKHAKKLKFKKERSYFSEKKQIYKAQNVADKDMLLPPRVLHDVDDGGQLTILTVGGIEHNRPLMHLINIHRQQHSKKRTLGFFDNVFDFEHKEKSKGKARARGYFLMGVNQPVSGLNSIFLQRENQEEKSISTCAKLIYFNIAGDKDNKRIIVKKNKKNKKNKKIISYQVISIYGFSALASAFATLYTVYKFKDAVLDNKNLALSLFNKSTPKKIRYGNTRHFLVGLLRFKPNDYMESRFNKICQGLEYFSFVRLDDKERKDGGKKHQLKEFITSVQIINPSWGTEDQCAALLSEELDQSNLVEDPQASN